MPTEQTLFAIFLGFIWGIIWALVLQTYAGRFLAARYTWVTVVIGIGGDLLIALLIVPLEIWIGLVALISASSLSIIVRSLFNEMRDMQTIARLRREHEAKTPDQYD
jgi:hypothetical protein